MVMTHAHAKSQGYNECGLIPHAFFARSPGGSTVVLRQKIYSIKLRTIVKVTQIKSLERKQMDRQIALPPVLTSSVTNRKQLLRSQCKDYQ